MFIIFKGCSSSKTAVALTYDEELAKRYCALKNTEDTSLQSYLRSGFTYEEVPVLGEFEYDENESFSYLYNMRAYRYQNSFVFSIDDYGLYMDKQNIDNGYPGISVTVDKEVDVFFDIHNIRTKELNKNLALKIAQDEMNYLMYLTLVDCPGLTLQEHYRMLYCEEV